MAPQANELTEIRDGPTGPRAGVSGGLDVWEIAPSIDDARSGVGDWGEDWVAGIAEYYSLSRQQVEAAIAYYDSHPIEIKIRMWLNDRLGQLMSARAVGGRLVLEDEREVGAQVTREYPRVLAELKREFGSA
jgi:hypothetical protein